MIIKHKKVCFFIGIVVSCLCAACTTNFRNEKEEIIKETTDVRLVTKIPAWLPQCACYVEDGLCLIPYSSTLNDYIILRCYDTQNNAYIWEKYIEGCGHANSICFRPDDRRIYIAECYEEEGLSKKVAVIDYDNIDKGVVDVINVDLPKDENLYSIAYDEGEDTFYGFSKNEEGNKLYSFEGVFDEINGNLILDDPEFNDVQRSMQGVQFVINNIAFLVYYSPDKMITGYDVDTGEKKFAYRFPDQVDNGGSMIEFGELESIAYDKDCNQFYIISSDNIFQGTFLSEIIGTPDGEYAYEGVVEISEKEIVLKTEIPQRWALSGCWVEDGIYIVCYATTFAEKYHLICYDMNQSKYIWKKEIDSNGGYANSICFRPQDRKLYIVDSYTNSVNQYELKNTISVVDYDNIDEGIIETIILRGGGI